MKKLRLIDILFIIIFVLLIYFNIKKNNVQDVDNFKKDKQIIDSLINVQKQLRRNDSIIYANKIESLKSEIIDLKKQRKYEYIKHQEKISKYNRPFDSTDFVRTNDSILQMLKSNHTN